MAVLVEIGPVRRVSAIAWLDYAQRVLDELDARAETAVDTFAIDGFVRLVGEWSRSLEASDSDFLWSEEESPEEVEYLIRALFRVGLMVEAEHEAGRMELRPTEADDFHRAIVRQVLAEIEQEGPASAQFVESLRDEWDIAGES